MTTNPAGTRVTRTEIAEHVQGAFTASKAPVTRSALLSFAITSHATPSIIETLQLLPEQRTFVHLRDLWIHLPEVPVA